MPEDADDGEDHTCEITVRVSDKDTRGVPVVPPQRKTDAYEGEEHVQAEEM
jgi:hypothetical protein